MTAVVTSWDKGLGTGYEIFFPLGHILGSGLSEKNETTRHDRGIPSGSVVKNLPASGETQFQSLGQEDPLEEEMATQSSLLAWRTPRTEEAGGL